MNQVMLVSREKKIRGPGGQLVEPKPIYLVPELCNETGLSDDMRTDFNVMKAFAEYTRMVPQARKVTCKTLLTNMSKLVLYSL